MLTGLQDFLAPIGIKSRDGAGGSGDVASHSRLADDFNNANPHYGQKGLGAGTWEGDAWKIGGGTNWGWYAYDPKTNLFHYGSGNPAPWNETMRPGDNKWTMTIWGRDADTGKAKFGYQKTPHDEWDYAGVNVMILSEQTDSTMTSSTRADTSVSMPTALARIVSDFAADSGTIHFIGEDAQLHLAAASAGMPDAVLAIIRTIPVGKGMAGLAVERAEPVTACNIQTDASGDVRPGAKATGLAGSIVVPIFDGETVVGALGVANRSERTFSDDEIARLVHEGRRLAAEGRSR